jgi:hypothetical protein
MRRVLSTSSADQTEQIADGPLCDAIGTHEPFKGRYAIIAQANSRRLLLHNLGQERSSSEVADAAIRPCY